VFEQIEAVASSAQQEGIPGDILFNKALEGAAKHVPPDRILPAVQAYASRLRAAQGAFGAEAGGPLLVAGADALQRGVSAGLLRGLGGGDPEPSPMAVLVLSDLVEAGVPGDQALTLVREAVRRRAGDQRMLDLPAEVRGLMRQGRSATDAVDQVRRSMGGAGRGGGGIAPVAPGSAPMGGSLNGRNGGR
jgi:hypothetical protein